MLLPCHHPLQRLLHRLHRRQRLIDPRHHILQMILTQSGRQRQGLADILPQLYQARPRQTTHIRLRRSRDHHFKMPPSDHHNLHKPAK